MTTQIDFTPEEWNVLRDAPHAVGLAVAVAGSSGLTGTMKEAWSSAAAILEGLKSDNPLIQRLADKEEVKAAQAKLQETVRSGDFKTVSTRIQDIAAERAHQAVRLLREKGTPADVEAFRAFLQGVGQRVAQAAKEGSFLGIGGERVSENERAMLQRLEQALS